MIEVLKQMQEALREYHYYTIDAGLPNQSMLNKGYAAFQAGKQAIAELESREPVAWADHGVVNWIADKQFKHASLLYTHPPQRTWQGLTDEDKKQMAKEANYHWEMTAGEYAERIGQLTEAKLKEKNT